LSLIKIVIADDEKTARQALKRSLVKKYTIFEAENGEHAAKLIIEESPDIVLLDINMPKKSGFEVLKEISKMEINPICIMMTAYGSERVAVEALKNGAWDYIAKPFQLDELRTLIKNASNQIFLQRENKALKDNFLKEKSNLLGQSQIMNEVRNLIEKVAKTDATVLIMGESGTGKEIAAKSIHNQSNRKDKPFIAINCGALPKDLIESELFGAKKGSYTGSIKDTKGKFELSHGGTLFLDEIGEMTLETQVKLLRVLEEKAVNPIGSEEKITTDIRIIAATNVNLKEASQKGNFREDLYYRLSVIELIMPPLREHIEDLTILIKYFVNLFCAVHSKPNLKVSSSITDKAKNYDWPGNVRELKNIIENAVVLSDDTIDESILFSRISFNNHKNYSLNGRSFQDAKQEYLQPIEEALVLEALEIANQNITKAAEILGMKRQYLQQKLKNLNLNLN
jgi:DNA-binding NtrC family response regulator